MPLSTPLRRTTSRITIPSGRLGHRRRDAQARRASGAGAQMQRLVDKTAVRDGDHLVDAVGELKAAILDMHRRLRDAGGSGR